jgi:hypothetical protein
MGEKVVQDRTLYQIWMVTYGASGREITHEMLQNEGNFLLEECYTSQGREFKYTLVYLNRNKRIRMSSIENFLKLLEQKYGIVKTNIFGYDAVVTSLKEIEEHPGFLLMREQMNNDDDGFSWWILNGNIKTTKSGLLWKYRMDIDVNEMPRTILIQKTNEGIELAKAYKRLKTEHEELKTEIEELKEENGTLKERVKIQCKTIIDLGEFLKDGPGESSV